jgi:hypothetical protein
MMLFRPLWPDFSGHKKKKKKKKNTDKKSTANTCRYLYVFICIYISTYIYVCRHKCIYRSMDFEKCQHVCKKYEYLAFCSDLIRRKRNHIYLMWIHNDFHICMHTHHQHILILFHMAKKTTSLYRENLDQLSPPFYIDYFFISIITLKITKYKAIQYFVNYCISLYFVILSVIIEIKK